MIHRPRGVREQFWCRRCPLCGYDLGGHEDALMLCPECGSPVGAGVRSVAVWALEPPNWMVFLMTVVFGAAFATSFYSAVMNGELLTMAFHGAVAVVLGLSACHQFRQLIHGAQGKFDGVLCFSPRTVYLNNDGFARGFAWKDVRAIRVDRMALSTQTEIIIRGGRRWWLLGLRRKLVACVAPLNRRERALVRNTIRRYWKDPEVVVPAGVE